MRMKTCAQAMRAQQPQEQHAPRNIERSNGGHWPAYDVRTNASRSMCKFRDIVLKIATEPINFIEHSFVLRRPHDSADIFRHDYIHGSLR